MKNLNEICKLEELNEMEIIEVNGGIVAMCALAIACCYYAGKAAGYASR